MNYLRFDYPNVGYVIDGKEDATVRYELEREFAVGDTIQCRTPGGAVFAHAEIEDVWTAPLRNVYTQMVGLDGRNHPAEGVNDLYNRMRGHYPEIQRDDEVTVPYLDVWHELLQVDSAPAAGGVP